MKKFCTMLLAGCLLFASFCMAQSSIEFVENKGQWGPWFQFKATTPGGEFFLEKDGFRYLLGDAQNNMKKDSFHVGLLKTAPVLKYHVYKVSFENCRAPEIVGLKSQQHYYNYFHGKDSTKWKTGIHPSLAVDYKGLYDGIDMHVSSEKGSLEYEFIVHPNGDATAVQLKFDGLDNMKLSKGNLVLNTSVGQMMEMKPFAYQYIDDKKTEVPCNYRLKNNVLTYEFPDGYNHAADLVIDPTVVFCSFTGSTADNWGFTATYDDQGNFYAGGLVDALLSGTSYPVSTGAFQTTFGGGQGATAVEYAADIAIMKLDPTGHTRIFATYIGGSANERPHSMIVDSSNNLIIAGRTHSTDYPVTSGAFQTASGGGWDIVVTKLNSTGTALIGSTYIGGSGDDGVNFDSTEIGYGHLKFNYGDDARSEVQIDKVGNIYVTGSTMSTDFPTTPTALATTLSGLQDGVVFKFNNNLSTLYWSTYLGGNGDDAGYVLAFNQSQTSLYVAGGTGSTNFPVTAGSWQSTYMGDSADGYIVKFKNSPPYNIQKGTYVGTANFDQVYGIQLDNEGNVYVMGQSIGGAFPVTSGVFSNPSSSQFVMKIDSNLTSDLISTVYGSGDPVHTNISPVAFLVDTCENIYISGWGGNLTLASAHSGFCFGMPITPDAYQSTTDGADFYFIVFAPGLSSVRYATYYGRNTGTTYWEGEHVDGGTSRFDRHGIIYQAICANCGGPSSPAFPTTAGSWATLDASNNCNEAALKIAFNIGPVTLHITANPSTTGCAPFAVNFTNSSLNTVSYLWNFGDGSPTDAEYAPTHTFTAGGVYTVTITGSNSNACFRTSDTDRLIVVVDTDKIIPAFSCQVVDSCGPFTAAFINTSHNGVPGDSVYTQYVWFYGDGTTSTGKNPENHNYLSAGTYTVTMVMIDTGACNSPDTVAHVITISSFMVSAAFNMPDSVCIGTAISPLLTSSSADTIYWNFGNGFITNSASPTYTYPDSGTYTVTVVAANKNSCNGGDTLTRKITVLAAPIANFSFSPVVPVPNEPITFTNLSVNAVRYLWDFGDKSTSTEVNPVHMFDNTAVFHTCLSAFNASNCPSKICRSVPAEVFPNIGIPTAFSPNNDGENDILYVRGAAIKTLDLKIYNRWGQMVFETTSQDKGWDGTYNGQPQPVEAYAYILVADFIDGTGKTLKGNVTLLR
jgi:gliding motility-associated-like protein